MSELKSNIGLEKSPDRNSNMTSLPPAINNKKSFFTKIKNSIYSFFHSTRGYAITSTVIGIILTLSVTVITVSDWYQKTYYLPFSDLLYILAGPIEGTGNSTVNDILRAALPYTIATAAVYVELVFLIYNRKKIRKYLRATIAIISCVSLTVSLVFASKAFRLNEANEDETLIYDQYYVTPTGSIITSDGSTKNLIYIYVESMETAHTSLQYGGQQETNYIPGLTELALNNVSFSEKGPGQLGGFSTMTGMGWTMGALFAATSGVPFSFSVKTVNSMDDRKDFAPGITTLGDVLHEKGYKNIFLCGSDADFGGRKNYFTQHGNYEIYDLNVARANGDLPSKLYHDLFWGFEDHYLYEIAKKELTKLGSSSQPFNFTMLTVDTHPNYGHQCKYCLGEAPESEENILKKVLPCTDRQITEFVEWVKKQPFYENTTIIITGDHPRHDGALIPDGTDRRMYNCFINSAVAPAGATTNREWSQQDIFPTTLAAMGFKIEGERLGLGTNMFSSKQTLSEELGYDYINKELGKKSTYYLTNFEYPQSKKIEE